MASRIGVVDYGAGNLFSVNRGIQAAGCTATFISDPAQVPSADVLLLPGVGAFGSGMEKLRATGMAEAIVGFARTGKPLLGICLGMQMLMSSSNEFGEHRGLDLIPGDVLPLPDIPGWPVPNIGWCSVNLTRPGARTPFERVETGADFYFVHSFHCVPRDVRDVLGTIDYSGTRVTAIVERDNVYGCQFHPEISAQAGLTIYRMLETIA
jgi:imidazole glycerol-phosphate synthase subunit HisH